jgi:hypothetical protein
MERKNEVGRLPGCLFEEDRRFSPLRNSGRSGDQFVPKLAGPKGLKIITLSHEPDGGFQMTGAEIAHARRYGLNQIVILLNNGGWGIFHRSLSAMGL